MEWVLTLCQRQDPFDYPPDWAPDLEWMILEKKTCITHMFPVNHFVTCHKHLNALHGGGGSWSTNGELLFHRPALVLYESREAVRYVRIVHGEAGQSKVGGVAVGQQGGHDWPVLFHQEPQSQRVVQVRVGVDVQVVAAFDFDARLTTKQTWRQNQPTNKPTNDKSRHSTVEPHAHTVRGLRLAVDFSRSPIRRRVVRVVVENGEDGGLQIRGSSIQHSTHQPFYSHTMKRYWLNRNRNGVDAAKVVPIRPMMVTSGWKTYTAVKRHRFSSGSWQKRTPAYSFAWTAKRAANDVWPTPACTQWKDEERKGLNFNRTKPSKNLKKMITTLKRPSSKDEIP